MQKQKRNIGCCKCPQYGHIQQQWKNSLVCPLCGEGHEEKICKSKNMKCYNYHDFNKKLNKKYDPGYAVWNKKSEKTRNICHFEINSFSCFDFNFSYWHISQLGT